MKCHIKKISTLGINDLYGKIAYMTGFSLKKNCVYNVTSVFFLAFSPTCIQSGKNVYTFGEKYFLSNSRNLCIKDRVSLAKKIYYALKLLSGGNSN